MLNFEYYTPTKVVFGKHAEDQAGELVKSCGCKKATGSLWRSERKKERSAGSHLCIFRCSRH